jgi:hypothetical protein
MITQMAIAGMLKIMGQQMAEKVILSFYIVLFFISFRYMLRPLTPYADYFAIFAGILAPNMFLYMGFWNFCFGVCILMFATGYYVRHQRAALSEQRTWNPGELVTLLITALLLYFTHIVPWVICVLAIALFGLPQLIAIVSERSDISLTVRRVLLEYSLPVLMLLLPIIFLLIHLAHTQEQSSCTDESVSSFRLRLWPLYNLSVLNTIAPRDLTLTKTVVGTLLLFFFIGATCVIRGRCQYLWPQTSALVLSLICGALFIVGPDCVGSGSYIHMRLVLFALLFFIVWLASALSWWPRIALNFLSGIVCALTILFFVVRLPVLSDLNKGYSEFENIGQDIRPGSTVFPLYLKNRAAGVVDPYQHALGILTPKAVVNLANYEAATDYFTTTFRADRAPFPALGTAKQLEAVPPVFDIQRYERATTGHVDYILCYGASECADGVKAIAHSGQDLSMFALVRSIYSERLGAIALYERR